MFVSALILYHDWFTTLHAYLEFKIFVQKIQSCIFISINIECAYILQTDDWWMNLKK